MVLVKHTLPHAPPPESLIQWLWGTTQDFVISMKNPQVILLVEEIGKHCFTPAYDVTPDTCLPGDGGDAPS